MCLVTLSKPNSPSRPAGTTNFALAIAARTCSAAATASLSCSFRSELPAVRAEKRSPAGCGAKNHPFKSGLTGETTLQFCDAYTAATGKQWTQPIGFKHANLEVAIDVLKRAKKLEPAAICEAIVETNYQSLVGPVAWKGGPNNPVRNACSTPLVGGQWKKGKKFKYDLHVVYNQPAPNIALDSPFEPIQYS